MLDIKISEKLQKWFSSIIYTSNNILRIKLSQECGNKELTMPFQIKDVSLSFEKLEKKLMLLIPGLSLDDYEKIESELFPYFENKRRAQIQINDQSTKKKEISVNKYSFNRKGELHESILIHLTPFFIKGSEIYKKPLDEVNMTESIEENTRILIPTSMEEYLHNPYEFDSKTEIRDIAELAQKETIFSLYSKAKTIISKYIDQEEFIINLISIDVIFSYFQDRFSTTHYVGIFGDNGSGKSSIGDIMEAIGYRAVNTTDPTYANIYRSLGGIEAGQITLILDEAEKIDQSDEMMAILKTGYDIKKQVSRINSNTGKPDRFYTYCLKWIIGEKPPALNRARGVLDRTFSITVYVGKPSYDIKEVLNPTFTGGIELKELLFEINKFRKIMLIFRLMHFSDRIDNIETDLVGRSKELVKPYLQLFASPETEQDKTIKLEIARTFDSLLKYKTGKKEFSLEAAIIPLIIRLMDDSKEKTIKFSDFWENLPYYIKGNPDERKPNEFHSEDFGTIYRNSISYILQKLGVESKRHNNYTELLFQYGKITKNAGQYNIIIQDKINGFNRQSERSERSEDDIEKYSSDNVHNKDNPSENHTTDDVKHAYLNVEKDITHTISSYELSPSTRPSLNPPEHNLTDNNRYDDQNLYQNLYRIGKTDTWACKNCILKGDKWFMKKHPCKKNK